ncbi:hypothetical protein C0W80_12435 [Photobacterium leiognathi subsp. mandapamensis]|uniref:fimbrial protein n=1 Tax=Photobacterium leiognathi TaxID=553611 RepID=UPI000D16AEE6|nr:fimbrial protein [Photobacterium leiognathi]PSU99803.1 hypothetical protein C0W80_12435 [Photobacterium leiognathi subsp. mandapamensis]
MIALLYSKESFALRCYSIYSGSPSSTGGIESFSIDKNIKVFPDTPAGTLVWRGEKKSVLIQCVKNKEDGNLWEPEYVYLYPGNTNQPTVPTLPGLNVGININGTNIYNTKYNTGVKVDKCYSENSCPYTTLKLDYYPIIVKTRESLQPITINSYPLFQVDGVNGFNYKYANFKVIIDNINNISVGKCSANLFIPDKTLSFGVVNKNSLLNTMVSKSFDINIHRNPSPENVSCPISINKAFVTSPDTPQDTKYISLYGSDNKKINLGVRLSHNNKNITIGDPFDLFPKTTLYDGNAQVKLNAWLFPINNDLKPGNFSGRANFNIIYN